MRRLLKFTLSDFWKNKRITLLLFAQLILGIFFFLIATDQFSYFKNKDQEIKKIEKYNITYFSPSFSSNFTYSEEADKELENLFDVKQNGFSIVESITLAEFPGVKVVVGLGAFEQIYNITPLFGNDSKLDTTIIMIGNKVNNIEVGKDITFGFLKQENYKVIGKLPKNKNYIIRTAVKNLDESILILTSKKTMKNLFGNMYLDEIIGNSCIISPSKSELRNYLSVINQTKTELTPVNLNSIYEKIYNNSYTDGYILFIFYLLTILFIFISIITNTIQLVYSNMREYSIHLLYGARRRDIFIAIIFYNILIISIPILCDVYLINEITGKSIELFLFAMFAIPVIAILIGYLPIRQLIKESLVKFMGRSE